MTLLEKRINITTITETKKKLKGTIDLDKNIMIYIRGPQNERAKAGNSYTTQMPGVIKKYQD